MRLPKSERFTDDCRKCGWCPEKENSSVPLGDCGLCFDCMDKFVETAVSHGGMDGCSTGDCPHEREADCVASQGEIVAEQAAWLDVRAGRIQRQNKMLMEKAARIAGLEAVVPLDASGSPIVLGQRYLCPVNGGVAELLALTYTLGADKEVWIGLAQNPQSNLHYRPPRLLAAAQAAQRGEG